VEGAGLPDGIFSNRLSKFGYILGGRGMDNVEYFMRNIEYFKAIWNI
jgi:hypothetical protein